MARVLLVNAHWGALFSGRVRRYNRRFPPLDLLNCAALLSASGHTFEVIDCRAEPERRVEVLHSNADIVILSLSSLDRWQCPNTDLEQLDRFISGFPMEKTVIYGAQVAARPKVLLQRTGACGAILGEPEAAVVPLADGGRLGRVEGTAYLGEQGELVQSKRGPGIELQSLPVPAFHAIDFSRYRYEVMGSHFGLLELTRGCPWRCNFCFLEMYGKKYRRKGLEQMLEEIRVAMSAGMRTAYFQDLEFTLDHALVSELCERLLTEGLRLKWSCQTRPDTVDEPLLRLMHRSGCQLIHYGVESGDAEVAKATGKRQSLDAVKSATGAARRVGMRTLCYFLIGMPGETKRQMEKTLKFAIEASPTYASFQVATPYPTTPWHEEYFATSAEPFPASFDNELSEAELRAYAKYLTARFHLRPGYLRDRLTMPGRRAALYESGLLARYLWPYG